MENLKFAAILDELARPRRDLSDLLVRIDIACLLLEPLEPGLWWDAPRSRRRLHHPEIHRWLAMYGFAKLADLPMDALAAFCLSIERHLARLQNLEAGTVEGFNNLVKSLPPSPHL